MRTKKVISMLLSVVMLLSVLSLLAVSSSAANSIVLTSDKKTASIGEIITVSYKVPAGLDGYVGNMIFSNDEFGVVSTKVVFSGFTQLSVIQLADNQTKIGYGGFNFAKNTGANEVLFTVKLQVKKMGGTIKASFNKESSYGSTAYDMDISGTTLTIKAADKAINYSDVKESEWYYDAVEYCALKGYIFGYSNGKFGPSDNLKRQDFVCILARVAKADLSKYEKMESKLSDIKKGEYYSSAVNWAVENKVVMGYGNGKFGVGDNITREQVCTILHRYMGYKDVPDIDKTLSKFTDDAKISAYARPSVAWAVQNNVVSGMADGRVAPLECASRAQIAAIIMNMDKNGMFSA